MPIKGLTCQETRKSGTMAVLGKLRKGAQKNGNAPGKDLDHFRFDTTDPTLADKLNELYGDKPGNSYENGIRFFFPSADFEQCMPTMKAAYKGGTCYVLCDGESIHGERIAVQGKEGSRWLNHPAHRRPGCRFPACLGQESCGPVGKLRIVIPEFQRFGVVEVVVGALNDLEHVSKQIAEIQAKVEEHGADLSMVPLILYRQNRAISTPKSVDRQGQRSQERARRDKSLIEVSIAPEFFSKAIAARNDYALASAGRLAIAGQNVETLAIAPAAVETSEWEDEFGKRVNTDFKKTELWSKIKMAFDQCRELERIVACHKKALGYCDEGRLPDAARRSLAVLAQNAKQRLIDSDVQPLPEPEIIDAVVVPEPSVLARFEAIALNTGYEMSEVEAIAKRLNMQVDDISQWSEAECQALRNWLYSRCAVAVKAMESTDAATAEYQGLLTDKLLDQADDQSVWSAWAAVLQRASKPVKK